MFKDKEDFRVTTCDQIDDIEINSTVYCLVFSHGYSEKIIVVEGKLKSKSLSKREWSACIIIEKVIDITPNNTNQINIEPNTILTITQGVRQSLFATKRNLVLYCNRILNDRLRYEQSNLSDIKDKYDTEVEKVDKLIEMKKKSDFILGEFEQGNI